MNDYLPEAMQLHTARFDAETLRGALESGAILCAPALRCDENHNLHLQLGELPAVIARDEVAMGIREGKTKEIAILSLVGCPVCFKVLRIAYDGEGAPTAILSRRLAQEAAQRCLLQTARPGDVLPAVVTHLEPFGAFCDVGCGFPALLGLENISISRIRHSRDRFSEGQQIYCVIRQLDAASGRISLSHKELLGTWEENAAAFQAGQTVTGIVRDVKPYGAFIELAPNLSGLAEPREPLSSGDAVSVYIKSILPAKQKIKLNVIKKLPAGSVRPPETVYMVMDGHLDSWRYGAAGKGPVTLFN